MVDLEASFHFARATDQANAFVRPLLAYLRTVALTAGRDTSSLRLEENLEIAAGAVGVPKVAGATRNCTLLALVPWRWSIEAYWAWINCTACTAVVDRAALRNDGLRVDSLTACLLMVVGMVSCTSSNEHQEKAVDRSVILQRQ